MSFYEKNNSLFSFVETNFDRWIERLIKLIEIDSISFNGFDANKLVDCAKHCSNLLTDCGLENVQLIEHGNAAPYVYADWLHADSDITVLLYAHYDVQPPMRIDLWKSNPFEGFINNGRLYGRGSADDKAALVLHLAVIESFFASNEKLPVNVKIIVEGEEEVGSPNLHSLFDKYYDLLKSDLVIIPDSPNFDTGIPTITTSLRGLVAMEIEAFVIESPLHSGMYGGPVPDPVMELSKIMSSLVDDNGHIAIPEINNMIKNITAKDEDLIKKLPFDSEIFKKQAKILPGIKLKCSVEEILLRLWKEPSLVINSFQAGGKKIAGNVLLDKAWCRLGIRTVFDMDPEAVYDLLEKKVKSVASDSVIVKTKKDAGTFPWSLDLDNRYVKLIKNSLEAGYENEVVFAGCGASIPFANIFSQNYKNSPAILTGIEDPYTNAHSENESLHLKDFKKAIISQIIFFDKLKSLS